MTTTPRLLRALMWVAPFAMIIAVITLPTSLQFGVFAAIVAALAAIALPMNVVLFIWAAILPIWSVGTIDPLLFDIGRIYLAVLVFVKARKLRHGSLWTRATRRIAIPLSVIAFTLVVTGIVRPDSSSLTLGATMTLSLVVAWMVISRTDDAWPILRGYLFGVVFSASVLILAAFGMTTVTPQTDGGFFRLTGLAPSATLVTYQLAIGVVVAWAAFGRRSKRGVYALALLICLAAIALSGGRGGVLALAVVLVVALRWRWFKVLPAVVLAGLGWLALTLAESAGITVNTLQRITDSAQSGVSNGRSVLLQGAVDSVIANPIFGSGLDVFRAEFRVMPHFALLTFFVAGGILCGALIIWVSGCIASRVAFVSPHKAGLAGKAAHLLLVVLIMSIFLEPSGPFVGMEFTTLMLLAVGITSQQEETAPLHPVDEVGRRGSEGMPAAVSRGAS